MKMNLRAPILLFLIFGVNITTFAQPVFPSGFSQVKMSNVWYPTAMTAVPDGRIFVCEKAGNLKVIKNGVVLSTPFLHVNVEETAERGLCGVVVDPDFANNKYVYVYYTTASTPIHNRLSRFTANGDVAAPGSEVILMDFEPVVNTIHNGGGMVFGNDGKLYLCMGDDKVSSNAQSLTTHKGKILRLNKDGTTPSDNPFTGSAIASRIWCLGLRNPYSIAKDPATGKLFVIDVGEGQWEEVNDASTAGKNFGWPNTEGYTSNPSFQTPVHAYPHTGATNTSGCAITGGVFLNASTTNYPQQYRGQYFFMDYCNDWINYMSPAGGTPTNFASNLPGSEVYLINGADGNLYYLSIGQSSLYKIVYSGSSAPAIVQQPASQSVSQGHSVSFYVTATGSAPLSYQWYKNGAAITNATSATLQISSAQPADQGQYHVRVSNGSGSVNSSTVTLTVTAFNAAPVASILSPAANQFYRGNDVIQFSGSGSDAEDGTLSASGFTWVVEFHHDHHKHPGPNISPGISSGSFTIPTTGEASANVFYRLLLVVKDSKNERDTAFVDIRPHTTKITFSTNPSGLSINYDGQPSTATFTRLAVENMVFPIEAVSPQTAGQTTYSFTSWSHGGARDQSLTIPQNDATLTANFAVSNIPACSAKGNIVREVWENTTSTTLADIPFNTAPTSTMLLTMFEAPQNVADNYGSRIRGFICPPATGHYTFWIASDNSSQLWLSSDANPSSKVKIAESQSWTLSREWTKYPAQQSAPIYLEANKKYYIEVIHRESSQGDHLAVGWQIPGGALERPIPGSRLAPYESQATSCTINGKVKREIWHNVTGSEVSAIPLSTTPSVTDELTQFKGISNIGDNYGQRLSGYLCPPATGNYTFWISSDNNSELWLSTNENPANKKKIAYVSGWTMSQEYEKYTTQKSASVFLEQGKPYYLEALHKEGTQGDNLSIGWALPNGTLERPIPGSRVSSTLAPGTVLTVSLTSPQHNSSFDAGADVVLAAAVDTVNTTVQKVEFYRGTIKIAEDIDAPYTYTWATVPAGTYSLTAKAYAVNTNTAVSAILKITVVTPAACTNTGQITREAWYNVSGTTVQDIPLTTTPDLTDQLNTLQTPAGIADNYGQRIRGFVCPPQSGVYRFFICSDDNSELWLSSDDSPANKTLVAFVNGWTFPGEWEKYPSQVSTTVALQAGQKYYIEALHKDGTQGDHVGVGWQLPSLEFERPVPGKRLIPFNTEAPPSACEALIQPHGPTTFCQGGSVDLFSNQGVNFSYQWIFNNNIIEGATTYSLHVSEPGSYQVRITYPGCIAYSAPTYVTINSELSAQITAGGPTTFCEGESVMLYGNTCSGYVYQWKKDGFDIDGANSHTYVANATGSYQLKVSDGTNINWSALVNVTVNDCGGSQARMSAIPPVDTTASGSVVAENAPAPIKESFKVKVFPNPTTGYFTFNYCLEDSPVDVLQISVISASSGQQVYSKPAEKINDCVKGNIELSSSLPTGIYILRIIIGERVEVTKLVLCR